MPILHYALMRKSSFDFPAAKASFTSQVNDLCPTMSDLRFPDDDTSAQMRI